eukprot:4765437-Prymnesium_polylepis.1
MRKSELRSFIWRAEADALLTAREKHALDFDVASLAYGGLWPMMRRVAVAGATRALWCAVRRCSSATRLC